eukprot:CAMPEP_0171461692 /NCGR_PEP_ID=MMETSP0945-20130129/6037_1 /TAXON_ID=109269 /ORGANISM="Vaucheria litorea, Strain CCMP2940" /LENGTH=347 /DNA_ID=CAMNT_0011988087 /DNA_START=398 /DNA_END=1441 /DNA_ORIENTATION=-
MTPTCPEGGILDSFQMFCCPEECGECGGFGCHEFPGGESNCCTSQITETCDTNNLPCEIVPEEICPSGGVPNDDGSGCCGSNCQRCDSAACQLPINANNVCCTLNVTTSCETGELPCVNIPLEEPKTCPGGILSDPLPFACNPLVCCPESCDVCDISEDCTLASECCAYTFLFDSIGIVPSDVDVSCRNNEPPCIMAPENDPCEVNPCLDGARCGSSWTSEAGCFNEAICECSEVGNNAGPFCDVVCDVGETPCGQGFPPFSNYYFEPNSFCCAADEECFAFAPLDGGELNYSCITKDRPTECETLECVNGTCYIALYIGDADGFIPVEACLCDEGYYGGLCEEAIV